MPRVHQGRKMMKNMHAPSLHCPAPRPSGGWQASSGTLTLFADQGA